MEGFAGETEELFAFYRLLLHEFPAFLGQALGAAALGFDGGDIDDEVLGLRGGEAGDELHFELRLQLKIDHALFQRFWKGGTDLAEEFHALERIDHAPGDEIARHDFGFLDPAWGAGENGFIGLVELLATGKEADGVGDLFAGGGDELQGEGAGIVRVVLAGP